VLKAKKTFEDLLKAKEAPTAQAKFAMAQDPANTW